MKLGVYMGSFNPPHKGHIAIINFVLKKKIVDKILVIPTLNYWDKTGLVDVKDRINMLKFFANKKIIIDEKHNDLVRTYELLEKLKEDYPNDEFYPIIGADNLISFDKWYNYEKLLKYSFLVIPRKGINGEKLIRDLKSSFILLSDFPLVDISSTEIRMNKNNNCIDVRVRDYISKHHLYEEEKDEKKN